MQILHDLTAISTQSLQTSSAGGSCCSPPTLMLNSRMLEILDGGSQRLFAVDESVLPRATFRLAANETISLVEFEATSLNSSTRVGPIYIQPEGADELPARNSTDPFLSDAVSAETSISVATSTASRDRARARQGRAWMNEASHEFLMETIGRRGDCTKVAAAPSSSHRDVLRLAEHRSVSSILVTNSVSSVAHMQTCASQLFFSSIRWSRDKYPTRIVANSTLDSRAAVGTNGRSQKKTRRVQMLSSCSKQPLSLGASMQGSSNTTLVQTTSQSCRRSLMGSGRRSLRFNSTCIVVVNGIVCLLRTERHQRGYFPKSFGLHARSSFP